MLAAPPHRSTRHTHYIGALICGLLLSGLTHAGHMYVFKDDEGNNTQIKYKYISSGKMIIMKTIEPNYKKYNVFKCKDHLEFKIS
mgnify:CR=1 FL=1